MQSFRTNGQIALLRVDFYTITFAAMQQFYLDGDRRPVGACAGTAGGRAAPGVLLSTGKLVGEGFDQLHPDRLTDFINANDFSNDALAELLGMKAWVGLDPGDFNANAARAQLRKLHAVGERSLGQVTTPPCLHGNVARLAELIGLSDTDCRILEFAVLIHSERLLDDCADGLGQLSSAKVFQALAVLLDLPEEKVRASLSMQGLLGKSGLLSVDRNGANTLYRKLDLFRPVLRRYCAGLAIDAPQVPQLARLMHLQNLTPGDFAAVARQNQFRPIVSCAVMVAALEAECAAKEGAKAAIGFLQ